jgi:hypothetical protein
MARRARGYVPPKKSKGNPPAAREPVDRGSLATINMTAGLGRSGIALGSRVTIQGSGLFAGETAVVEKLIAGVIPSALVRTEAGRSRQVRTIDLEPVRKPTE